jgi:hypothetical protein
MKGIMAAVFALLFFWAFPAASEPWDASVDANLTVTQNAYSDNWEGGEVGSIAWAFTSNSHAQRQFRPTLHTKNTLKLAFGQTHSQDKETKDWAHPVKSTDLIDFETVLRFTFGWFVDPFAAGRVKTQFLDQRDPEEDKFINPVLITESLGVARVLLKEEDREWTARIGGAFRQHIDSNALVDSLAGTRESQTTTDGGFQLDSEFVTPLAGDRLSFSSKLTVYKAIFFSESDEVEGQFNEDYWKAPDVDWENIFTASITKYLMVNLYINLLYDKEIDVGGRLKETLSVGLTYKFI